MRSRYVYLLACLCAPLVLRAGDPPAAVKEQLLEIATLIRSGTATMALHRIDSLLAVPERTADAYMRQGLHAYKGRTLRMLGKYDDALAEQTLAYAIADSLDDEKGRVDARMVIGLIYMDLRQLDRSRSELLAVRPAVKAQQSENSYRVDMMLGRLAELSGSPDSALYWYGEAQAVIEAVKDSAALCEVLYNQGILHRDGGRLDRSEQSLVRCLASLPANGYPQVEGRAYQALARLHLMQKRYDDVPTLLDKAMAMAVRHGAGEHLVNVISDRIDHLLVVGDTLRALMEIQRQFAVKDSLAGLVRDQAVAEVETRFGMARMEEELALTRAEAEVNALRAQRSWIAWGALAVISLLATILIFNFRKQYLAKKKAALVLEQDKERLSEENELLHQENLMARFETLKSQIDPHFLFNAMNTLYTLVETEPKKAREFVSSFSALYRKVLTSRERTIVPVKEELELVHHYLFLQRIRFGDSLQVEVDVPASALHRYLPPFTLQMLLENAVKHNVISAAHPLHIHIGVEQDRLVVRNDLRPRGTSAEGTGTGLENIRKRYAMLGAPEPTFAVSDPYYKAAVPMLSHEP